MHQDLPYVVARFAMNADGGCPALLAYFSQPLPGNAELVDGGGWSSVRAITSTVFPNPTSSARMPPAPTHARSHSAGCECGCATTSELDDKFYRRSHDSQEGMMSRLQLDV